MTSNILIDRLQFALTIDYHYIFVLLTLGLVLFIVYFKAIAFFGSEDRRFRLLRKTPAECELYEDAAVFWVKIFAVNFIFGVVSGIPMEFQFGTNWANYSNFAGGVVGTTLGLEGIFAFAFESAFLGFFLAGRQRVGDRMHLLSAVAVWLGSWFSGYFIVMNNGFMQHPVGFDKRGDKLQLTSISDLLTNPWAIWEYLHTLSGAMITGSFVMAAMGAFFLLSQRHEKYARLFLRTGVVGALIFATLQIFPTGDTQARNVERWQPSTFASMEGLFESGNNHPLVIIGNPNMATRKIESSIFVPDLLTFLTFRRWSGEITGLNDIPQSDWPSSIPLVYYAYHIMVGLGTIFLLVAGLSVFFLWRRRLFQQKWLLWILMLIFPFTYIANFAGWATAEAGRQPWVVFGLLRTADGASPATSVPAGTALFTLLGFAGLILFLSILYLMLLVRIINQGPKTDGKGNERKGSPNQPTPVRGV